MESHNMKLSKEHRNNLEKLAGYLLNLPKNYANFHMKDFYSLNCSSFAEETAKKFKAGTELRQPSECGAVACALGHGPAAGIPFPENAICDDYLLWGFYSKYKFGLQLTSDAWDWCFSSRWEKVDNTPHGAGMRIIWLLTNGLPDDWIKQISGEVKLCYK